MNFEQFLTPLEELANCNLCPRNCHSNRFKKTIGYCRSDAGFNISSICIHRGEEPVISGSKGICNIFFTHCNLRCVYCQNHQISRNLKSNLHPMDPADLVKQITSILDTGINSVGFVSPSHNVPQVKAIIAMVESMGYDPVWIYNTNGYDKVSTLKSLEHLIDVYLPDFKYSEASLAADYSDVTDYPEVAMKALREMFRQKGSALITGADGTAESGMIIRHLVLPGHVENSIGVLRFIAEELSPRIHISLMSQYYPTPEVVHHPLLKRNILPTEYSLVSAAMDDFGLHKGWIQEFDSMDHYRPDFDLDHPFEG